MTELVLNCESYKKYNNSKQILREIKWLENYQKIQLKTRQRDNIQRIELKKYENR